MGTNLRVLSVSYPMNTTMTGFRYFSKISASLKMLWTKIATADDDDDEDDNEDYDDISMV